MTESLELRRLKNENDTLKRENSAFRKKFGELEGRSCLAITCRMQGRTAVFDKVLFISDSKDKVQNTNWIMRVGEELGKELEGKPGE